MPTSPSPVDHASRLWHRPERVATWTFALGAMAASSSLGVFTMAAEARAFSPFARDASSDFTAMIAAAPFVSAMVWAAVIRAAVSVRPGVVLGIATVASFVLAGIGIIFTGISHSPQALYPKTSLFITPFLGVALAGSFVPVLRLARRAYRDDGNGMALDVPAAGFAWTAAVASIGVLIAPGLYFRVPGIVALGVALVGLFRVHRHARKSDASRARTILFEGLRKGGLSVLIAGLMIVPVRLVEQRKTRNPAVIAIYERRLASPHCDVRSDGREGDITLWREDCGSIIGPTIGWDERAGSVLQGEELYARVPRLRSAAPYSTGH